MEEDDKDKKPTLKINLEYNKPTVEPGGEPQKSNAELTDNYILAAVTSSHPQGLEGQQRRVFSRIQRKLDDAIDAGRDEIELEKAEQDFLRKSFNDCKVPAALAKYFIVCEQEVERATKV